MKVFTQAEFDAIPRDERGVKHCPSGDYTRIKEFGERCWFGAECWFGARCSFGAECMFGSQSDFGMECRFGEGCWFGSRCDFGAGCWFGSLCEFGAECFFCERCSFGKLCRFGELCVFGGGCSFEGGRIYNGRYVAIDRIGSANRKTYFFRADEGLFVRAGCWFGTFDEFEKRVHEVHKGTRHERDYMNALAFVRGMLEEDEA